MSEAILNDILGVIQKAAIDGVLTKIAVDQFNSIIGENESLKSDVKGLTESYEGLEKRHHKSAEERDKAITKLKKYIAREDELVEREENMLKLELTAEYEAERVKDHKEMFSQVFRNIEMRRNVFTALPGATAVDQYGNVPPNASSFAQEDTETTKVE